LTVILLLAVKRWIGLAALQLAYSAVLKTVFFHRFLPFSSADKTVMESVTKSFHLSTFCAFVGK
jgi:hypothetical protein